MVNYKIEAAAIRKALDGSNRVLVIAHKRPDADALGAALAWLHYLEKYNKEINIFCIDKVPASLRHLLASHRISQDTNLLKQTFDAIIVNDSSDLEYAGIHEYIPHRDSVAAVLINIDHHVTNSKYGNINLVVDTASSTTEIIARLLMYWEEEITKPIAESLLHGIITDTDSLTNPATTYHSLHIASELVRVGADLHGIVQRTLLTKSVVDLKLWGLALSRLRKNTTHGIVSTYLTKKDLAEHKATNDAAEGISNFLTLIPDFNVVAVLQEIDGGYIKVSLRTIKPTIDVGGFALALGGGGHRRAAGFKVLGTFTIDGERWTIE